MYLEGQVQTRRFGDIENISKTSSSIFWNFCYKQSDIKKLDVQWSQGVTKRCRLSWLTNSALVYEPKCGGGGLLALVSANEYSCAYHVTWIPNKLWRTTSIFKLWLVGTLWGTALINRAVLRCRKRAPNYHYLALCLCNSLVLSYLVSIAKFWCCISYRCMVWWFFSCRDMLVA